MMKIIVAMDEFKVSLSVEEAAGEMRRVWFMVGRPEQFCG